MEYTLIKFIQDKIYEIDEQGYIDGIYRDIFRARGDGYLSKFEARDYYEDTKEDWNNYGYSDMFWYCLMENEYFDSVFQDTESIQRPEKVRQSIVNFWEYLWVPFIEEYTK